MAHPISRRELIRKFRSLGFTGPLSGGRHQFMKKGVLKVRIPKPSQKRHYRWIAGEGDSATSRDCIRAMGKGLMFGQGC
jgi:hypothetical protein